MMTVAISIFLTVCGIISATIGGAASCEGSRFTENHVRAFVGFSALFCFAALWLAYSAGEG